MVHQQPRGRCTGCESSRQRDILAMIRSGATGNTFLLPRGQVGRLTSGRSAFLREQGARDSLPGKTILDRITQLEDANTWSTENSFEDHVRTRPSLVVGTAQTRALTGCKTLFISSGEVCTCPFRFAENLKMISGHAAYAQFTATTTKGEGAPAGIEQFSSTTASSTAVV